MRREPTLGFTSQSTEQPVEAFASTVDAFSAVQVSRVQNLPKVTIGRTEVVEWKAPDGKTIEGLLTYPAGYQTGSRVPLLVIVHGGPAGVFLRTFTGNASPYLVAAFASRGYALLRCNVRGSSGYGRDFRYANRSDWGGGDYRDIMSGVDHLISKGIADPDRMGVMGWSYGGYMTLMGDYPDQALQGCFGRGGGHEPDEFHRAPPIFRASCPTTSVESTGRFSIAGERILPCST